MLPLDIFFSFYTFRFLICTNFDFKANFIIAHVYVDQLIGRRTYIPKVISSNLIDYKILTFFISYQNFRFEIPGLNYKLLKFF